MRALIFASITILSCLLSSTVVSQMQCGIDEIYKNNPVLQKQIQEQIKRIEKSTNIADPNTVFTIPVVFILYHKGEPPGEGSNISNEIILQQFNTLNDAFRARNGFSSYNDMKIEFALANCGELNSIVRVNASSVPDYVENGLDYNDLIMMFQLRSLHNWNDRENYITIELVHKMNGAGGFAGYLEGYTFIDVRSFGFGIMAHELGHVLNLKHTFEGDVNGTQCPVNDNPDADGDMISDTPPHKSWETCFNTPAMSINPCDSLEYGDIFENFLSYSQYCWHKFTPKQILRARISVEAIKPNWINSPYLAGQTDPPTGTSNLKCGAGPLTLYANGCLGTYSWYSTSTGGDTLATGATFITPSVETTTTYYVDCKVASCAASIRIPVQAIITPTNECYCESYATYTGDEEILSVSFANLTNSSTCNTTGGPGSVKNSYSDYTFSPSAVVYRNQTYPFSVQIGTCGGFYNNALKIFIDFNHDKDFDDQGEEVYASPVSQQGAHTESGTITIPPDALLGITRMRVVNVESNVSSITPCGFYGFGETEDYGVNIIACPLVLSHQNINLDAGVYNATDSIDSKANTSNMTTYMAGKFIVLLPGFSAGPNEVFISTIGGCN